MIDIGKATLDEDPSLRDRTAMAAVARAIGEVAEVAIEDDGTVRAGGATFRVGVAGGRPHVVAVRDIGDVNAYDPRACLAHNATLAVGALGFVDDRLVLRHACSPQAVTPEAVRLFLHEADRLRGLAVRGFASTDVSLWAGFAD
jgi:hypothetical protein